MRTYYCLLSVFLMIFHFEVRAINPERVLVLGGEMFIKNQKIEIESFQILKYEITNAQYAPFLNSEKVGSDGVFHGKQIINISSDDLQLEYINGVWQPKYGKENYPMVMVSYYGAVEFSKWMGGKLPTETEWTFAAKGGTKSENFIYAGSNNLDEVGWFRGNCEGHSHEVGKKKPNELGIYDMSGNVWEWCLNDSLKSDTDFCVHMGGSWYPGEEPSRISSHFGNTPTHFSNSVGFRVLFASQSIKRLTHNCNDQ
jgi:formylglycine-generating enzyme required for sulfatase activity